MKRITRVVLPKRSERDFRTPKRPRILQRKGAGEERVSAKGVPYRVCAYAIRVQALLFPRERYTEASAIAWARSHEAEIREVRSTERYVRIQVAPSKLFVKGSFRTVPLRGHECHGILAVMACPRLVSVEGREATSTPARRRRAA